MATRPSTSMASVLSDCKALEHAYDKLRSINEELQYVERELCRLSTFSAVFNLDKSKRSSNWRKYAPGGFGNQDPWCSDWWQRAMHSGIHESGDKLDRELEKMNASKTTLMPLQSGLRARINRLSRPHLGNLNILNLPDEILLEVFELVEGFDPDHPCPGYYGASRNDIKNTRLVCRRFCDVSSQLLVRLVRVKFDEQSLARLEAISRHPAIAKGVRVVQVVLHFYNRSLTNFNRFVSYHSDELEEVVNVFDHGELWKDAGLPEQVPAETIADGRAVIAALNRLASPDPADVGYSMGDEDHAARLEHIHREYLILYENQESLIWSGKFSRVVGSAIARMPRARRLEFSDVVYEALTERRLLTPGECVWGAVHRSMLQPVAGYHTTRYGVALPDYGSVVDVIDSVRRAGAMLQKINIQLSTVGDSLGLVPAPDLRQELSSGLRQLKAFEFRCEGWLNEQDASHLGEFLSACLDTSSLHKLRLDMRCRENDTAKVDVTKVLGSRPRRQLTDIFITPLALDLSELVRLLRRLPESMRCFHLQDVRLLSGDWKEALEAFREKRYYSIELRDPQGAECDDMAREDYEKLFQPNRHFFYSSEVESYILYPECQVPNPIRFLEDP